MTTKIWLLIEGKPRRCIVQHERHGDVDGACPHCGTADFKVQGTGKRPSSDDLAWEADGVAVCCNAFVGTIRAETNTLFGVREDRAVLEGRCRVY